MKQENDLSVRLRPWAEGDSPLLARLMGDPEMTKYLGGPEDSEQLARRHQRYVALTDSGKGQMFVIVGGDQQEPVGSVGYWETEWQGRLVWETGWSVLPEFQGQGIATKATVAVVEQARAQGKHRFIHAFPSVDNGASNAVCRKAGFTLASEVEFESWRVPGQIIRFNDWRLDLSLVAE